MNWIEFIWYAMAGSCLTLGGICLLVWLRQRDEMQYLSLALAAAGVSAMAVMEQLALRAASVAEFADLVRWFHVPAALLLISLVLFVRLRYRAGSVWLGGSMIAVRLVSLVANFSTGVNLNFTEITSLTPWHVAGTTVMVPHGAANPWMVLGQLSLLLLVGFVLHAGWEIHQRGQARRRWRDFTILGSVVVFLLLAGTWSALVTTGMVATPFFVVPLFAGVVLALGYDLGAQLLRVPKLSRSLADSEAGRHVGEFQLDMLGRARGFGMWSWDCRDGTVDCSPQALLLLDFPPGQPFDRERVAERISPPYRAALKEEYLAAERGGGHFRSEFCLTLRDGGVRWLAAVGDLERDVSGRPLSVQGILLDIGNRREADHRFSQVVEAAPMAILLVQPGGAITFANSCAEQVFGYSRRELCGLSVEDLVPRSSRGAHPVLREQYSRDPASRNMAARREVSGVRKDGSEIAIEVNISTMPTESGPQVLAIVNDISARKRAEQEAGTRRDEVAHLSRVALLAELSGSLAHELNQPLTAILSNAQAGARFLARDPPDLDEVRESLRNIVESDKRAGEVIRRLRAMMRKEPPDFQRLDMNEVVADVLHIMHSDLISRSVEVRLQLQAELPPTMGDRIQLQQVLLNLIMNGCDAMASCPGRPALTIRTRHSGANTISVDVSDVGRGIAEADLERIFAPFVSSKSAGMGLGLAVCTTIVQTHQGRLWAENNAGPGATLHLELRVIGESSLA